MREQKDIKDRKKTASGEYRVQEQQEQWPSQIDPGGSKAPVRSGSTKFGSLDRPFKVCFSVYHLECECGLC